VKLGNINDLSEITELLLNTEKSYCRFLFLVYKSAAFNRNTPVVTLNF